MLDLMNLFMGPLNEKYCMYFLIIAIIALVGIFSTIISALMYVYKNLNKTNNTTLIMYLSLLLNLYIVYFANRLLYSMCVKSLS